MKWILNKTIWLWILILVGCTATATPTAELEAITLQFNWEVTIDHIGFAMAVNQGFYAEEGLDVTLQPFSQSEADTSATGAVLTGESESEYGAGSRDLLQAQSVNGIDTRYVQKVLIEMSRRFAISVIDMKFFIDISDYEPWKYHSHAILSTACCKSPGVPRM